MLLSGSRATLGFCLLAALGLRRFAVRGWRELGWLAGAVAVGTAAAVAALQFLADGQR